MKTLKSLLLSVVFTALATLAQAQVNNANEQPYIEVNGVAEKDIIPDEIYIAITLHEKYENKVKMSIEEQEEKLKNSVKAIGINLQNLYLSDITAGYVKVYRKTKDVITNKNYMLKVGDAAIAGKVFQELEKLNISDATIAKISHSKLDSIKREVRIMAIKAAKEKADYLLSAIGEQTGKPIVVRETEAMRSFDSNVFIRNAYNSGSGSYSDNSSYNKQNDIEFQKIKVQSGVYVKFSIK